MRLRTPVISSFAAAALVLPAVVAVPTAHADPAPPEVIASGFLGPLHLSFGPGGALFVSDAFAGTVNLVSVADGSVRTVVQADGFTPGVDVRGNGAVMYTLSQGDPDDPFAQGPTSLQRANPGGRTWQAADLLGVEREFNPDGQDPAGPDAESNPYSVLVLGDRTLVADAAANSIIEVPAGRAPRPLTAFPNINDGPCAGLPNNDPEHPGCDPVPTDLEIGPDGYLYVSGLGAEVEGHVYKVNARTGQIVQTWGELPPLTGIAVDRAGAVYVASLFTDQVFRMAGGVMTVASVPAPTDVEYGPHGLVVASMTGDVLRIGSAAFG